MKEKKFVDKVESLVNGHSVLVAHPPPLGTLDEVLGRFHAGSRGLFELISRRQPALFICGHIHERPGTAFIGQTFVVNCNMGRTGGGALIEFEKGETPEARMLRDADA
jgi:Icc-related predicted phosphoesterase